jgi:hypothetical protein
MTPTDKITHIVINCQVLNNRLADEIANKAFKQTLKAKSKVFLDELIKVEHGLYNSFFDAKEDSTVHVYDVYDNFMQQIAKIPIWEMENIGLILKAYEKDSKSIEGITKKILK